MNESGETRDEYVRKVLTLTVPPTVYCNNPVSAIYETFGEFDEDERLDTEAMLLQKSGPSQLTIKGPQSNVDAFVKELEKQGFEVQVTPGSAALTRVTINPGPLLKIAAIHRKIRNVVSGKQHVMASGNPLSKDPTPKVRSLNTATPLTANEQFLIVVSGVPEQVETVVGEMRKTFFRLSPMFVVEPAPLRDPPKKKA